MSISIQRIQHLAGELHAATVEARRHLHAHPELSFHEAETAAYVASRLHSLGIPHTPGVGGHGIVARIKGGAPGPVVALRADMDALPIAEANDVPYKSTIPGVMHACGHDAHTASLLGTAHILWQLRHELQGSITLLFQPAEEKAPGGASLMIRDGALRNPDVQRILGQHVQPQLEAGKIGVRSGIYMASADELYLRVRGTGGHAANPAAFVDPVIATAHILTALQTVVSRSDPRTPSVLSFGKLLAEGAVNVIPDEVVAHGTFRTMHEPWRAEAKRRIRAIAQQVGQAMGCTVDLEIVHGYPVLHNDPALTAQVRADICDYMGEEHVVDLDLWMASEDFAYYTQEIPGCFYRLGTRNEARGIVHGLHTPRFDIEEAALAHSTGLMAWLAVRALAA